MTKPNYMTWREIYPLLLRILSDKKAHERSYLKLAPEEAEGFDHAPGSYGEDSMTAYRAGWTLTLLKNAGLAQNVKRGFWQLTPMAMGEPNLLGEVVQKLVYETAENMNKKSKKKKKFEMKAPLANSPNPLTSSMTSLAVKESILDREAARSILVLYRKAMLNEEETLDKLELAIIIN